MLQKSALNIQTGIPEASPGTVTPSGDWFLLCYMANSVLLAMLKKKNVTSLYSSSVIKHGNPNISLTLSCVAILVLFGQD